MFCINKINCSFNFLKTRVIRCTCKINNIILILSKYYFLKIPPRDSLINCKFATVLNNLIADMYLHFPFTEVSILNQKPTVRS